MGFDVLWKLKPELCGNNKHKSLLFSLVHWIFWNSKYFCYWNGVCKYEIFWRSFSFMKTQYIEMRNLYYHWNTSCCNAILLTIYYITTHRWGLGHQQLENIIKRKIYLMPVKKESLGYHQVMLMIFLQNGSVPFPFVSHMIIFGCLSTID